METIGQLSAGEPLELVAPFEPVSLYRVMEAHGYEYATQRADDGSWHITFRYLDAVE
jgi:uncharacterized protein (DUF2249 family)